MEALALALAVAHVPQVRRQLERVQRRLGPRLQERSMSVTPAILEWKAKTHYCRVTGSDCRRGHATRYMPIPLRVDRLLRSHHGCVVPQRHEIPSI